MSKTQDRKIKQQFILFIVTFLVSLIVITYFIKSFSPNVDVEIGGEYEQTQSNQDSDSDVKNAIDDRLRWIQMEDNMPGASKRDDLSSDEDNFSEEKVRNNDNNNKKQEQDKKSKLKELDPIEFVTPKENSTKQPPTPENIAPTQVEPPKMSKVYVGSYTTIEQAIQAQTKLMNTSSSISPFVKEVNGKYVLQAGSYANTSKAEAIAKEINALGFSAKVVKE